MQRELILRMLTGIVAIPLVLGIILLGTPYSDIFITLVSIACLYEWFQITRTKNNEHPRKKHPLFLAIFGGVYILTSLLLLIYLSHKNPFLIIFFLLIVWSADTGAYFSGRFFGGPKLAPRISPSKTWSGFLGGTLLGVIVSFYAPDFLGINISFGVCFLLILASHAGDLLESMAKRYYHVKDSGFLIPGHGGFLDRLDSLFLVTIFGAIFYI